MTDIELVVYKRDKDNKFDVFVNNQEEYYNYCSAVFPPETTLKEIFEFGREISEDN